MDHLSRASASDLYPVITYDIFVQEVTSEGLIVVETTYTIIEVQHIRNWTYINIVRDTADDQ